MRDPRAFQFDLPQDRPPASITLREKIHPAAWACSKNCTHERPANPFETIKVIVIHATAGASTNGAISVMRESRASFHWVTADENEPAHGDYIWATAPERRAAWHVRNNCSHPDVCSGEKRLNDISLGVEIVNAQSSGDHFSDWQITAAANIVRYAWAKYPKLTHVVSHARLDPKRRTDPGVNFPWERFKTAVLKT